jgi:E3 ubiquitin-protein ligase DMA1/2
MLPKTTVSSQFQCPNCRAYWDLNADVDVDVDMDDDESINGDETQEPDANDTAMPDTSVVVTPAAEGQVNGDHRPRNSALLSRRQVTNPDSPEIASVTASSAIDVPRRNGENGPHLEPTRTRTPDTERLINGEGPLTPRNDVGPFILDGSAGRRTTSHVVAMSEVTEGDSTS